VITTNALTRGEISNEDRDYVARIVAAEARIPPEDARKRVDATIEQAKQAANTARKATAGIAFLIGALSMFAAGAAYWAAMAGGRERDENVWR
jgi:CHASE3 domain sensor protein